jgi:hypothetical protein
MASSKKRRIDAKLAREQRAGGRPAVHPDGDRRRRGGERVEDAIARKRAMQQFPGPIPPG